jgi:hypothetical protein
MKFNLELNEKQAYIIQRACELYARMSIGQGWAIKEAMEHIQHEIYSWQKRDAIDEVFRKEFFPELVKNSSNGIGRCEVGDTAWVIHEVIRHEFWKNQPEEQKKHYTVDSNEPSKLSGEPPPKITTIKEDGQITNLKVHSYAKTDFNLKDDK